MGQAVGEAGHGLVTWARLVDDETPVPGTGNNSMHGRPTLCGLAALARQFRRVMLGPLPVRFENERL